MRYRYKSIIFWGLAILMALVIAVYQRVTGPTHHISGTVQLDDEIVSFKLLRTWGEERDAKIVIPVSQEHIMGEFRWKRYKSNDTILATGMDRTDEGLVAYIPQQPPAGKVAYGITLYYNNQAFELTPEPVVIRFKGKVPDMVVFLHVIFIFMAFIFSMRTGLEALVKGKYTFAYTTATMILLILGGLIFGPIMQKYAFGAYWTGWPWGHDLTDNKTAVAALFWIIAFFAQLRKRAKKQWATIAALVLLLVYLIPHSLLGSEIDYTKSEAEQITHNSDMGKN